jgi:hypothetical protein
MPPAHPKLVDSARASIAIGNDERLPGYENYDDEASPIFMAI